MRTIAESYRGGVAVTPSDTTVLEPTRGIYVGGAGNISLGMADGSMMVLTAIQIGVIHPLSVTRVLATSTTATVVVAIY